MKSYSTANASKAAVSAVANAARMSPAKASHIVERATTANTTGRLSTGMPVSHTQHPRSGRC